MATVLITQCLQRDFVDPIGPHDPLPNLLHVGHAESTRLLGTDPSAGPLAQLVDWARRLPPGDLDLIHIRDWHDPDDPTQRDHLAQFGAHCIKGTSGARLVLGMDEHAGSAPNERIVDSLNLNDLEGTDLAAQLDEIRRSSSDGRLRVGVVGVWTEAKVSFLLYDLKTRLGIDELATCSALTASASRTQHFNALSQLEKILGVHCFESLADFVDWLQPGSELELPAPPTAFEPRLAVDHDGALEPVDRAIIAYLFRDSTEVELEALTGGFSGSLVWRATSHDAMGHRQAPSVAKIGPNRAMAQERVAFERIESVLGNNAPRVRGYVDLGDRAGLKYSYAAMGQGKVRTLKSMFAVGDPLSQLIDVVRTAFEEVLGPLYAAAQYERLPLLEHYGFSASLAPNVRDAVASVTQNADDEVLEFVDGWRLPNVVAFYVDFLARFPPARYQHHHYVSYVHGDLNAANILVDAHDNVWVIDFFHSAPGHVLKDLAKFENDLLYVLTPLADPGELVEALTLTRALRSVVDLKAPLQDLPEGVRSPHLVRAWQVLRVLRRLGSQLCHEDRHPVQLQVALLRYAVHTLGFEESSHLQRQWALASACSLAEQIVETTEGERILRVDWIDTGLISPGRLGITVCPGRRDRGRDLVEDVARLRAEGADRVLCLLTDTELLWAGVADLASRLEAAGIGYRRLPVPDQGTPDVEDARELADWCRTAAARGERVVVTCMGGLGRSGTVAACALVRAGAPPETAIAAVRAARGPRALETLGQEDFVTTFAADNAPR